MPTVSSFRLNTLDSSSKPQADMVLNGANWDDIAGDNRFQKKLRKGIRSNYCDAYKLNCISCESCISVRM